MKDRKLPTPKSPLDVDKVIDSFKQLFGRAPNGEELSTLEFIRKSLIDGQSSPDEVAAD